MPRDFNEHPLMWSVNQTLNTGDTFLGSILMEATPPSVQDQVKHLASRFWQDWKAISQYVVRFYLESLWEGLLEFQFGSIRNVR